ncbi:MAG: amidohydrolase family protein [Pseudomonadota bacterium]
MSAPARITGTDSAGRFISLTLGETIEALTPVDDAAPGILVPGLIDLQVNGYGGIDLNAGDLSAQTVAGLCAALLPLGVTGFLPTLITASQEQLCDACAAIAEAHAHDPLAARLIAGIHIEGPWISPEDGPRGAHPHTHVRAPSHAEAQAWQRAAGGLVRMVTLAPEWPEAPAVIAALLADGIQVAIGHTNAAPDDVRAAVDAGASLSTHLGNGALAVLPRHPNFIWTQLADPRLTATFIADGHHLPADPFRAMLAAKGLDRAILVSDTVSHAGMPPGRYESPIGGAVDVSADGRVSMAGTPYLAGAGRPLLACLSTAMAMADLTLADAVRLASINPGRLIGRTMGFAPGARADIVRLTETPAGYAVCDVWLGGQRAGP